MRFILVLLLAITGFTSSTSAEVIVKTYPEELRDDGTAYLYKDHDSILSFYLFNSDSPVRMRDVELKITLPKDLQIISWNLWQHKTKQATRTEPIVTEAAEGAREWTLPCGGFTIDRSFAATKWTVYSDQHIYVHIATKDAGSAPSKCTIPWQLEDQDGIVASGEISAVFLPKPQGRSNPKQFKLWTSAPYGIKTQTREEFSSFLELAQEVGVSGIVTAHLPRQGRTVEMTDYLDLIQSADMQVLDRTLLSEVFRARSSRALSASDIQVEDHDFIVDITGGRVKSAANTLRGNVSIWCPSHLSDSDSPVLDYVVNRMAAAHGKGVTSFFVDYELDYGSCCFCPRCRDAFAAFAHLKPGRVANMEAWQIVHEYPVKWYEFRSTQTGRIFNKLRNEIKKRSLNITIGINDAISVPQMNTPGIGFGYALFAEDPRIIDFGVDFHVLDTLKGSLEDVIRLDLCFRPEDAHGREIRAGMIGRAGTFYDINWNYFCVVGRREWAEKHDQKLGTDTRAAIAHLQIANMAALGAKGIEMSLAPDMTDSLVMNAVDRAMAFVAEFEPLILKGERLPDDFVTVVEHAPGLEDYKQMVEGSDFPQDYVFNPVRKYGPIQYSVRKLGSEYFIGVFNWDLARKRTLTLRIPSLQEGPYLLEMYRDGVYYQLTHQTGKTWDAAELTEGFSIEVPAAGVLGFRICRPSDGRSEEVLAAPRLPLPHTAKQVDRYAWRDGAKPSMKAPALIYNKYFRSYNTNHSDTVPKEAFLVP